ncbi:Oidioi.mRNA.OKI2018_I69.chr1.g1087.t1.cds [Oikopleura dioica]|uniref:Oidioi.mRNA.OKI2018_I69.chr1.g1087.t1.cds n=1 Tax=Oikopleura dioica TaxID=34765 RepID=A0ABN7SQG4_OIKDI|nr:Oidioi.mRNA.OKI2018_I69.chr1.g1087.t1.cds [Oikopleura dioica]
MKNNSYELFENENLQELKLNERTEENELPENRCSSHGHSHKNDRGKKRLIIASILTLIFVVGEFVAGILAKSTAVQADAAHMLTDLLSFGISLLAISLSDRRATNTLTSGWDRAEVLGATFTIILLWIITAVLGYIAVENMKNPEEDLNENIMIAISSAAIAFNILLACVLRGSGHGHTHGPGAGHNHSHDAVNIRAAMVHIVGDLVQSIGVLAAGIFVKCYPGHREVAVLADPICTFLFMTIVFFTTLPIIRDLAFILMGGVPEEVTVNIKTTLVHFGSLKSIQIFQITPEKYSLSIEIESDSTTEDIKQALRKLEHNFQSIFVEIC